MGHIVDNVVDVGPLYFFLFAPKTVTRSVSFLENHICCHPLLPSRTDSATMKKLNAEGVIFLHLSSMPGRFFFFFWFTPSPTESFVTYFDEKMELHNCSGLFAAPRRGFRSRAKKKRRGSCRSWATLLNLSLIPDQRILRSLQYTDSRRSFLLEKP